MGFKAQFGKGLPPLFSYMDSLSDFVQYAYAYYAACVLALMREQDVERELKTGDATTILRALWDERSYIVPRVALAPTGGLGYDPMRALLWVNRDELTRLLLRKTPSTQQTTSMTAQSSAAFTTFYWDKPFYTYTTRFLGDPTFQTWAPPPDMPADRSAARNPYATLPPSRRHLLRYLHEAWPTDFALRPDDPLPYQGVLFHGFQEKVAVLGIRKDRRSREH